MPSGFNQRFTSSSSAAAWYAKGTFVFKFAFSKTSLKEKEPVKIVGLSSFTISPVHCTAQGSFGTMSAENTITGSFISSIFAVKLEPAIVVKFVEIEFPFFVILWNFASAGKVSEAKIKFIPSISSSALPSKFLLILPFIFMLSPFFPFKRISLCEMPEKFPEAIMAALNAGSCQNSPIYVCSDKLKSALLCRAFMDAFECKTIFPIAGASPGHLSFSQNGKLATLAFISADKSSNLVLGAFKVMAMESFFLSDIEIEASENVSPHL
ncbi:hypothetical protein R83H12_02529 [Fibrobacteria bacterium R8-3-H12]